MFIQSLVNRISQSRGRRVEQPRSYLAGQQGYARFRRDLGAIAIGLLIASVALGARGDVVDVNDGVLASASVEERVATSRGFAGNPQNSTGKSAPTDNAVESKPRSSEPADSSKAAAAKSGLFSDFEIYDANVTLYFDDDFDGHYYGIDVNFDADTDYALAEVYARLYLSLEGGPWELYHTTEIFTLIGDTGGDDYTVETELYSGYPTAYYDVLIELYDADTGDFVAEFGPDDSIELEEAPLEDQQKDAGFVSPTPAPIISHSHGGGGATSLLSLALLMLIVALRQYSQRARPAQHLAR